MHTCSDICGVLGALVKSGEMSRAYADGAMSVLGKRAGSMFGGEPVPQPTLNDLLMQVGGDFAFSAVKRRRETDMIRAIQATPGHSVSTPVGSIRGAIGNGLRAIADRYFTPKPLGPDNIPGYRRIGQ